MSLLYRGVLYVEVILFYFSDDIRVTCCFLSQALRKLLVYRERQRMGLKDQKVFIQ